MREGTTALPQTRRQASADKSPARSRTDLRPNRVAEPAHKEQCDEDHHGIHRK